MAERLFLWCPNPKHGLFDYFVKLKSGKLKCTTCGYEVSDTGKKRG